MLTGKHVTGLESNSEGVRNRASVVGVAVFAAEGIGIEDSKLELPLREVPHKDSDL